MLCGIDNHQVLPAVKLLSRTGCRFDPQVPGGPSNTPAQSDPQNVH